VIVFFSRVMRRPEVMSVPRGVGVRECVANDA
jgi:hypothetical protein